MIDRRAMIASLGATVMTSTTLRRAAAGSAFDQRLRALEQSGRVFGLHALTVTQGGRLVFEHYGVGDDQDMSRNAALAHVSFGPTVLHDLRSVSKSVVSWLYGIALSQGKVPAPETRLSVAFPQYADLLRQPGRDQLTVAHLLSMTLDEKWDEFTIPYGSPGNSETDMEASPDRYRYVVEQPILGPPGVKWTYNGGCTTLIGRLITEGTGEKLHAYARRVLFDPLQFGPTEWAVSAADGNERAASGLRLLPRDMARIGRLVLSGGAWNDKQIVPADWVKRATMAVVRMPDGRGYGYHWYTGAFQDQAHPPLPWIAGIGWGGQRLYIIPKLDLVVGINCGNYARTGREQSAVGIAIVTEVVLPAFG